MFKYKFIKNKLKINNLKNESNNIYKILYKNKDFLNTKKNEYIKKGDKGVFFINYEWNSNIEYQLKKCRKEYEEVIIDGTINPDSFFEYGLNSFRSFILKNCFRSKKSLKIYLITIKIPPPTNKNYETDIEYYTFYPDVEDQIQEFMKINSEIIGCSATANNIHINGLKKKCKYSDTDISLPYDSDIFNNEIVFDLIQFTDKYSPPVSSNNKYLIIKENKKIATEMMNNYYITTYLNDPSLVGSNKYDEHDTFIFDFFLKNVKYPIGINKLGFFTKIGNGTYKTEEELKKGLNQYSFGQTNFMQQNINKILQAVGRLNRGSPSKKKHVYVKDPFLYKIIKDYLIKKLNKKIN